MGGVDRGSAQADDATAYERYTDAVDRCRRGQERARRRRVVRPPRCPEWAPTVDALCPVRRRRRHRVPLARRRGGRLLEVPGRAVVRRAVPGLASRRSRRRDRVRRRRARGTPREARARRGVVAMTTMPMSTRRPKAEAGPARSRRRRRGTPREFCNRRLQDRPRRRMSQAEKKALHVANCATAREMAWVWAIAPAWSGSARGGWESDPGRAALEGRWEAIPVPFSMRGDRHARHETAMKPEATQP